MTLKFTRESLQDLDDLDTWLADRSPQGLKNVIGALKSAFRLILENPGIGKPTRRDRVRLFVEPSYRYLIPYYRKDDVIWILRVYHTKRMPLDVGEMRLP
jgi:toxin ParE1/3/4